MMVGTNISDDQVKAILINLIDYSVVQYTSYKCIIKIDLLQITF